MKTLYTGTYSQRKNYDLTYISLAKHLSKIGYKTNQAAER